MRKFKKIDLWISIILITGFAIASIINFDNTFILGYFVVGGWQVASMIVHATTKLFTHKGGSRYYYHWITVISLATFPVGSFLILLFIAPVMAIYYSCICFNEVKKMNERPLAMLK